MCIYIYSFVSVMFPAFVCGAFDFDGDFFPGFNTPNFKKVALVVMGPLVCAPWCLVNRQPWAIQVILSFQQKKINNMTGI